MLQTRRVETETRAHSLEAPPTDTQTSTCTETLQESLAQTSMALDDPPASSTASSTAAAMRGKVGSEFET